MKNVIKANKIISQLIPKKATKTVTTREKMIKG
jgi:hypothetical protein